MAWIELVIAGMLEVFWSTMMKWSDGFSKLNYSVYTILGMIASFYFLSKALKHLPMSLSYPIWTGIGAVGSVIIGVVLFHDKLNGSTWFFVGLLLISIIGLKLTSGH
ncbi:MULTISPECIES: multidrug efflux SMR transporter [unclassified Enterococcus]|uniref:DMT family transporter n=1 Tax=unclassified Enterococcus TaxID=2608891 RepID=UPI0013ECF130|nr:MULTISPECIES: multidrug efflux SMR transporter [unclassified Enterococcus]